MKEHMFCKAVMSRLEKTAVGVDRRSDIRGGEGKEVQKGKICKSCWNKNDGTERRDSMEATILETALSQGIWAALAVFLLISMMKENEKADQRQNEREARYQTLLTELTAKFEILDEMKKDIRYIRSRISPEKDDDGGDDG